MSLAGNDGVQPGDLFLVVRHCDNDGVGQGVQGTAPSLSRAITQDELQQIAVMVASLLQGQAVQQGAGQLNQVRAVQPEWQDGRAANLVVPQSNSPVNHLPLEAGTSQASKEYI